MVEITKKDLMAALRGVADETVINIIDPATDWQSPGLLSINADVPVIQVVVPDKNNPNKGKQTVALVPRVKTLELE